MVWLSPTIKTRFVCCFQSLSDSHTSLVNRSRVPGKSACFYLCRIYRTIYGQPELQLNNGRKCISIQMAKSKMNVLLPLPSLSWIAFILWHCICPVFVLWMARIMLSWRAYMNFLDVGIQVAFWLHTDQQFLGAHLSRKSVHMVKFVGLWKRFKWMFEEKGSWNLKVLLIRAF